MPYKLGDKFTDSITGEVLVIVRLTNSRVFIAAFDKMTCAVIWSFAKLECMVNDGVMVRVY